VERPNIADLSSDILQLKSQILELREFVSKLQNDLKHVQTEQKELREGLSRVENGLKCVQARQAGLEEFVSKLRGVFVSSHKELQGRALRLENAFAQIHNSLGGLTQKLNPFKGE
jgi:predicted  nucleic acid-binding Zn-ribbon protein